MKQPERTAFLPALARVLGRDPGTGNFLSAQGDSAHANQQQTNDVFSEKWKSYDQSPEKEGLYAMQKRWYLQLYGFGAEEVLAAFLREHKVIFDAGCGLGYKAAWFAELAPESLVIGMDFSEAAQQAALNYAQLPNLFFLRGDIAHTGFASGSVAYVSCDQVIMHTENPEATFAELARITAADGEFACYFYAKKALPRELLDDYFRVHCKDLSNEQIWALSEQLTELGKRLSELKVSFESPDIPALGIKGGTYDVQRFLYWNFLKCFWNPELGRETSVVTNFDWYSPSNARRFSEEEVRRLVAANGLQIATFHQEEACHSGRFRRQPA
ncbi:MAG: Methyltransferase type 11 [Ramlibacter sp.]|nr:Methyltransferase type 11 [Ramlibacter sp.]